MSNLDYLFPEPCVIASIVSKSLHPSALKRFLVWDSLSFDCRWTHLDTYVAHTFRRALKTELFYAYRAHSKCEHSVTSIRNAPRFTCEIRRFANSLISHVEIINNLLLLFTRILFIKV